MREDQFGTDPRLLHRADSPQTSIDAAYQVATAPLERMVYAAIKDAGTYGMIQDDLLDQFPTFPYSSITARFASLRRRGLIERIDAKRPGKSGRPQQVMRAKIHE